MQEYFLKIIFTSVVIARIRRDHINIERLKINAFGFIIKIAVTVEHKIYSVEIVAVIVKMPAAVQCAVKNMRYLQLKAVAEVCKITEFMVHAKSSSRIHSIISRSVFQLVKEKKCMFSQKNYIPFNSRQPYNYSIEKISEIIEKGVRP